MTRSTVNAWVFLNEDEPAKTNYNSENSCYQRLIKQNVYQSMDSISLCFAEIVPVSASTIPATPVNGQASHSSYTVQIGAASHPDGLTNQDYMEYILRDAKANNPAINIGITLVWGNGNEISQIFADPQHPDQASADQFAANLVKYMQHYKLSSFDIDWEAPLSSDTTQAQFTLVINAIGSAFKSAGLELNMAPAEVGNLDATAINNNVNRFTLQLYSGFTSPSEFTDAGVDSSLFAYGAKFEATGPSGPTGNGYQTAQQAVKDNQQNYHYQDYTVWRLNSENYIFEQDQMKALYEIINGTKETNITTSLTQSGLVISNTGSDQIINLAGSNAIELPNGASIPPPSNSYWHISNTTGGAVLKGSHGPLVLPKGSSATFVADAV